MSRNIAHMSLQRYHRSMHNLEYNTPRFFFVRVSVKSALLYADGVTVDPGQFYLTFTNWYLEPLQPSTKGFVREIKSRISILISQRIPCPYTPPKLVFILSQINQDPSTSILFNNLLPDRSHVPEGESEVKNDIVLFFQQCC